MFSTKKNVLETVALIKAYGIDQVVLSPGSRNAPLIQSFAADPFFTCHLVVDERSAGFFAIGLINNTIRPVALCCTSGSALLNYGPAVAEAFYQELPLIVVSADRSPAWIGQMDGQTLPQQGLFGSLVRKSVQLPEIQTNEDLWFCNRLINEALTTCTLHGYGPVHINVPISEPLFDFSEAALPEVRRIQTASASDLPEITFFQTSWEKAKCPMIVLGQMPPTDEKLTGLIEKEVQEKGCVVLGEHLCNAASPWFMTNFDAVLAALGREKSTEYAPDLLITVGGHIVSKRLKKFLRANPAANHWHVSASEKMPDTFQCLTHFIQTEPVAFFQQLFQPATGESPCQNNSRDRTSSCTEERENGQNFFSTIEPRPEREHSANTFFERWWATSRKLSLPGCDLPFSDITVTGAFMDVLPPDAVLFTGNSSSVRNIQLFPLPHRNRVFCNRGVNGIEGSVSAACG